MLLDWKLWYGLETVLQRLRHPHESVGGNSPNANGTLAKIALAKQASKLTHFEGQGIRKRKGLFRLDQVLFVLQEVSLVHASSDHTNQC